MRQARTSTVSGLLLILAVCAPLLALAYWYFRVVGPQGDEHLHVDQILRFTRGDFSMNPAITQIPGYHAALAAIAAVTGRMSLFSLRLYTLAIAVYSIVTFFVLARRVDAKTAVIRTLQYAFLPILTPFFMLVYTDVLSLLLVLLAVLFADRRQTILAGIPGILAVLTRQMNVVWLLFVLLLLMHLSDYWKFADAVPHSLEGWWDIHVRLYLRKHFMRAWIRQFWLFLLAVTGFGLFAAFNNSIALGDKGAHPFPSFHLGNVYFALFVMFALFLPLHVANLKRLWNVICRHTWLLWLLPLAYGLFLFTFTNDHYNNQLDFFLRNKVLMLAASNPLWKSLFFVPVFLAACSLAVTRISRIPAWVLYLFAVLSVIPSWLIEQRYYLVPIALFMALRERRHWLTEYTQLALYVGVTAWFLWGIREGKFFL